MTGDGRLGGGIGGSDGDDGRLGGSGDDGQLGGSDGDGFDVTGPPLVEPAPDEDAWEAYLEFALDRIGDDLGPGLTNRELAAIETLVGAQLPFEVGMLLVMGVPETLPWVQWHDDPETIWRTCATGLRAGLLEAVDDGYWSPAWGARPEGDAARRDIAAERLGAAPGLFPLWADHAVPLGVAEGRTSSDANPVVTVRGVTLEVRGVDLAAWMHAEFGVPLPMWQPDPDRRFAFWSDL